MDCHIVPVFNSHPKKDSHSNLKTNEGCVFVPHGLLASNYSLEQKLTHTKT